MFEDAAECGRVGVAGAAADLVYRVARRLEKALGLLNAGVLQVCLRAQAGGR